MTKPKSETNEKNGPKAGEATHVEVREEAPPPPGAKREPPVIREPVLREPAQREPDERPGLGMRESDDLPPARVTGHRFTREDIARNAKDIVRHFGHDFPALVAVLADELGMRLVPNDGKGKTHTGKFVALVGLRVQPKGEGKVRTVKAGEIISLTDEDADFFGKKNRIEPELV